MTLSLRYLRMYYPVLALLVWFGSFAITFTLMPPWFRWLYIVFFPVLIAFELLQKWRAGNLSLAVNAFDAAIGVYCVFVFGSLQMADSLRMSRDVYAVDFLFQFASPVLLYCFIRLHPLDRSQVFVLAYACAAIIVIESILGFISLRYPTWLPTPMIPRAAHIYRRGTGSYESPEAYVNTLLFGAVIVFYIALKARSVQEQWFMRAMLLIAIIGAIISQNRTGWFNLALLIVVIVVLDRSLIKWFAAAGVAMVVAALLFYPDVIDKTEQRFQDWRQVESRVITDMAGVRMVAAKPILGWGFATFDLHDWKYMRPVGGLKPGRFEYARATSHNTYLTILGETGFVGFALYVLTTLYWLWRTVAAWRQRQPGLDWNLLILMWTMIAIVQIAGQLADMRFFPFITAYWWFALAMVANHLVAQEHHTDESG